MNKTIKLMLMVAVIWGTMVSVVLLVFHNIIFVVDIRWKDDKFRIERSFNLQESDRTPNNRTPKSIMIFTAHKRTAAMKLHTLPVHTLNSLTVECSDLQCIEVLSAKERLFYDNCKEKTISMEDKFGPILNTSQCRFQNGTDRFPVALASFPGSGNTWLRGLLEKVTGICTG